MGAQANRVAPIFKFIAAALLLLTPACGSGQAPEARVAAKLEKMAERGNAEAIYHLGMMHHVGLGVPQDKAKALDEFRAAAKLGDPLGAYKLGCYYDGQGEGLVQADAGLALKYKLASAEAGYALAQQDVAALYARQGDMQQALMWLRRAADQGWSDALMTFSTVHNGRNGLPRDPAVIAAYFRLYLNMNGGGDADQQKWLDDLEAGMTAGERSKATDIVSNFHPQPTALTLKGLAGISAAERLVESGED